jgi:polyisoprenoid-binding protein YceI
MKKTFIALSVLLFSYGALAQKAITRSGEIKFEASMPALEEVAATNSTVSAVLDKSTGDIAFLVLVKGFKFKAPLMEEHFNENYMESDKYPKATFKGKIIGFDKNATAEKTYDVEGDLTIHNVTKKVKQKITFKPSGKDTNATFAFTVKPQDYNIAIPALVKNKIAENVKVNGKFSLTEK